MWVLDRESTIETALGDGYYAWATGDISRRTPLSPCAILYRRGTAITGTDDPKANLGTIIFAEGTTTVTASAADAVASADIVFTAGSTGRAGDMIQVVVDIMDPLDSDMGVADGDAVAVASSVITVSAKSGGVSLTALATAINADTEAAALVDVVVNSGAEIIYEDATFTLSGGED